MNERHLTREVRKQRSIWYASQPSANEFFVDYYMHMFLEDVSRGIMPIGGRSSRAGFKVSISPEDKEIQKMIVSGLREGHLRDSLANSLDGFFSLVATQLCEADSATFEIVYFEEPQSKKLCGFELAFIPVEQLSKKKGLFYQCVPREIADDRNVPQLIPLPEEELIVFQVPETFQKPLRDMRATFRQLRNLQFPGFALEAMKQNLHYDFKAHERAMKLALVECLKKIGWTARGTFYDQVLSYYWIRMELAFHSFKIRLRDAMLSALNDGLERVGRKIGFSAEIKISGLPTLGEVAEAMQKLDSGSMAFTEIMKPFDIHQF